MADHNDNSSETVSVKRIHERYINIHENIFKALTPTTIKVYLSLRFDADYCQESSSVKRTALQIAQSAGISRCKSFQSFNELENFGLLKRECRDGLETIYWVAQNLNHFKPKSTPVQNIDDPVQNIDDPVQNIDDPVQNIDTYSLISSLSSPLINSKKHSLTQGDYELEQSLYFDSAQQKQAIHLRKQCLADKKCLEKYETLPDDFKEDKTFIDVLDECVSHYATQLEPQLVSPQRLYSWINREIRYFRNHSISSATDSQTTLDDCKKDTGFMSFYTAYPKKEDPLDAFKAFRAIVGNNAELLEEILIDIEARKARHTKWQDKQFIKKPAVYLMKGEYLGEIYNEHEANKEKERTRAEENKKRMDELEKQSRERQEANFKNSDGQAYRNIVNEIRQKDSTIIGLKNLKNAIGLK